MISKERLLIAANAREMELKKLSNLKKFHEDKGIVTGREPIQLEPEWLKSLPSTQYVFIFYDSKTGQSSTTNVTIGGIVKYLEIELNSTIKNSKKNSISDIRYLEIIFNNKNEKIYIEALSLLLEKEYIFSYAFQSPDKFIIQW